MDEHHASPNVFVFFLSLMYSKRDENDYYGIFAMSLISSGR